MGILKIQPQVAASNTLFDKLYRKEAKIAVVGLGYVGLPLAVHMASKFRVVGFDINQKKIEQIQQQQDPCKELSHLDFIGKDFFATDIKNLLGVAKFYIVAVPTPINNEKQPNLAPLKSATATVAEYLKKGDVVVFESTVYPGCTEEVCVPILEEISGLTYKKDFQVGYSPERINPGDTKHTFTQIKKIVSGSNQEALDVISKVYEEVVTAGIHKAPSIQVAEAAKVVENIQRDVNIGLMNQLSQIFSEIGLNTSEVLEAAGTKWNFHNYYPGLVGGHCIGVDPYYLIHKAAQHNVASDLLKQVRNTNEGMIDFIVSKISKALKIKKPSCNNCKILVKGITFKENVNDIRNSKAAELCLALQRKGYTVIVQDNHAYPSEVKTHYGIELTIATNQHFDAIVLAVDHDNYKKLTYSDYLKNARMDTVFFDIKGDKKDLFPKNVYMSL